VRSVILLATSLMLIPWHPVNTCAAEGRTASTSASRQATGFAGSVSCRECHETFYSLWSTSHHGLAMQPYTAQWARTQLTGHEKAIVIGRYRYRAETSGGAGWVLETGPKGSRRYRIEHVMGGKNVYYFLTALETGRLQTLPVAYDVNKKEWFDTAASGIRHFPGKRRISLSTGRSGHTPSIRHATVAMSASSPHTMIWRPTPTGPSGQSLASTVRRATALLRNTTG